MNEIILVQSIGYDLTKEGVRSTVLLPSYIEKGKTNIYLMETDTASYTDVMADLAAKTNQPIEYGQLRMVLFSNKYARQGIEAIVHSLCRDPKIVKRMQLGVAQGESSELLKLAQKHGKSFFLADMVEHNIQSGNLPNMNLYTLLFNFYGEGRDLFLPYLKVEQGEVKVDGLALFNHDQFVTSIDLQQAFLLKLLIENTKGGSYVVPLARGDQTSENFVQLTSLGSKREWHVKRMQPFPVLSVDVRIDVEVKDVPSKVVAADKQFTELEDKIGAYLESEVQRLLALCRNKRVDPAGLGDFMRSETRSWDSQQFDRVYPQMQSEVKVKVRIIQTGLGK